MNCLVVLSCFFWFFPCFLSSWLLYHCFLLVDAVLVVSDGFIQELVCPLVLDGPYSATKTAPSQYKQPFFSLYQSTGAQINIQTFHSAKVAASIPSRWIVYPIP
jgi:hypothetical protein